MGDGFGEFGHSSNANMIANESAGVQMSEPYAADAGVISAAGPEAAPTLESEIDRYEDARAF